MMRNNSRTCITSLRDHDKHEEGWQTNTGMGYEPDAKTFTTDE